MGCFADDSQRDMTGATINFDSMTIEGCIGYCLANSYEYAGLQIG